jgi:hypothetical protein
MEGGQKSSRTFIFIYYNMHINAWKEAQRVKTSLSFGGKT